MSVFILIVLFNNIKCSVLDLSLTAAGVLCLGKIVYIQYDINRYQRTLSPDWEKYEEIKKGTSLTKKLQDIRDFLNEWDQHYLKRYGTSRTIEGLDKLKLLDDEYNKNKNSSNKPNVDDDQYNSLVLTKEDIQTEILSSRNMQCMFLLFSVLFLLEPCKKLGKNLKTHFNK